MLLRNKHLVDSEIHLSTLQQKIIHTLLYHEVFAFPMTLDEICYSTNHPQANRQNIEDSLTLLIDLGLLRHIEGYYLIKHRPDWIKRRKVANQRAKKLESKAMRRAKLVTMFPFVRAVFFSGTFAKGLMHTDSDVDFFIITQQGRLWLARTLLVLYKKIFLLNSRKFFCVNYFIDDHHLQIDEKNLFTATEVVTLRPAYGSKLYDRFRQANNWVDGYYPHYPKKIAQAHPFPIQPFRQRIERYLSGKIGDRLETLCFKRTLRYWTKKFVWMDSETFDLAIKSRSYVSKHHPHNFQDRVLRKYRYAIDEFEKLHGVRIRSLSLV